MSSEYYRDALKKWGMEMARDARQLQLCYTPKNVYDRIRVILAEAPKSDVYTGDIPDVPLTQAEIDRGVAYATGHDRLRAGLEKFCEKFMQLNTKKAIQLRKDRDDEDDLGDQDFGRGLIAGRAAAISEIRALLDGAGKEGG